MRGFRQEKHAKDLFTEVVAPLLKLHGELDAGRRKLVSEGQQAIKRLLDEHSGLRALREQKHQVLKAREDANNKVSKAQNAPWRREREVRKARERFEKANNAQLDLEKALHTKEQLCEDMQREVLAKRLTCRCMRCRIFVCALYCGSLWFCIVRVKSYRRMETPCDFSLLRFPCTQQVLQELVPELIKKLQLQESTRASFMFTAFERLHREARSSAEVARDSAYGLSIAIGLTDADLDAQEPTTNRHFTCVWCPRVALATVRLIPSKPATLLATLRLVLACGRKDFLTHSSEEGAVSAISLLSPACKSWLNERRNAHSRQATTQHEVCT